MIDAVMVDNQDDDAQMKETGIVKKKTVSPEDEDEAALQEELSYLD